MSEHVGNFVAKAFHVGRVNRVYSGEIVQYNGEAEQWKVRFSDGDEMQLNAEEVVYGMDCFKNLPEDFKEGKVVRLEPWAHLPELPTRDARGRKRDAKKKYPVSRTYVNASPCPYCGSVLGTQKGAAYHIENKVCVKLKERKAERERVREERRKLREERPRTTRTTRTKRKKADRIQELREKLARDDNGETADSVRQEETPAEVDVAIFYKRERRKIERACKGGIFVASKRPKEAKESEYAGNNDIRLQKLSAAPFIDVVTIEDGQSKDSLRENRIQSKSHRKSNSQSQLQSQADLARWAQENWIDVGEDVGVAVTVTYGGAEVGVRHIPPFQVTSTRPSSSRSDFLINAVGPVRSLGIIQEGEIVTVAIGTSYIGADCAKVNSVDELAVHNASGDSSASVPRLFSMDSTPKNNFPNLVQLHKFKLESTDLTEHLGALLLEHAYGPVWDLIWLPTAFARRFGETSKEAFAAVFGDGNLRVVPIPMLKEFAMEARVMPLRCRCCSGRKTTQSRTTSQTCLAVVPETDTYIVTGTSDGCVIVWAVTQNLELVAVKFLPRPFIDPYPSLHVGVRALTFRSATSAQRPLLAAAYADKVLHVWDIDLPELGSPEKAMFRGVLDPVAHGPCIKFATDAFRGRQRGIVWSRATSALVVSSDRGEVRTMLPTLSKVKHSLLFRIGGSDVEINSTAIAHFPYAPEVRPQPAADRSLNCVGDDGEEGGTHEEYALTPEICLIAAAVSWTSSP